MKWLKITTIAVCVFVMAFVVLGLALGSEFEVQDSHTIEAPTREIHEYLLPLHKWREPVQKGIREEDPTAVVTTDGPDNGVGSMLRWRGDSIGEGWVRIVQEDEDRGVWYEFGDEDKITARASISYLKHGDGTDLVVECRGELAPVIGGYIAPLLERKLREAIAWGLIELEKEIEDGTILDGIFNEANQSFD